jgi:phosphopantothenoylcysteine decarboxylase/phosphopantothenate--cysteine ligase
MLAGKHILLGVTGGIAAYKAAALASRLTGRGAIVKTVMTEHATRLVTPRTFQAVTGQPVYTSLWHDASASSMEHIDLVDWADVCVVAPATANIIAKTVHGLCDDLLSTLLCVAWEKPRLFAPAMNTHMWQNPVTQKNVALLADMGIQMIGPNPGRLACGTQGPGRMAEPEDILQSLETLLA